MFACKEEKVGWCTEKRNHAKSRRYTLSHFGVAVLIQLLVLALYRNAPIWTQNTMGKMQGFYISRMRILEALNIWQILNISGSEINDCRPVKFLKFSCVCHLRHTALLSARFTASPWWIRICSSLSPVLKRVLGWVAWVETDGILGSIHPKEMGVMLGTSRTLVQHRWKARSSFSGYISSLIARTIQQDGQGSTQGGHVSQDWKQKKVSQLKQGCWTSVWVWLISFENTCIESNCFLAFHSHKKAFILIKEYLQVFPLVQDAWECNPWPFLFNIKKANLSVLCSHFSSSTRRLTDTDFFKCHYNFFICGLQITVLNKLNYSFKLKTL